MTGIFAMLFAASALCFGKPSTGANPQQSATDVQHRRHVGEVEDERHRARRKSWHYHGQHFRIEKWKSKAIRFSTLEAVCEALGCQPGDILEYQR
jgi:hypothetical protein